MPSRSMPARTPTVVVIATVAAFVGCDCGSEPRARAPGPDAVSPPLRYGLRPEQAEAAVLRLHNGRRVSLLEFAERLGPPPRQRNRPPEVERRRAFLDRMVEQELLAAEAEERGYADQPVDAVRQAALAQAAMDKLFGTDGELVQPVTDADVRAAYDSQTERFTAPERRRASHIQLASEDAARVLLGQLKRAANLREAFGEAALNQTHDMKTRGVRGDLGYFTAQQPPAPQPGTDATVRASMRLATELPQPLRDAAFRIPEEGQLYDGIVQTSGGFHVLLLTGKQGGQRIEFEQVARALRAELLEQRRAAAEESLATKLIESAKPVYHDANLALVRVP